MLDFLLSANHVSTQFLHGSTNYSMSTPDWHKTDDPWGAYLNSDAGKHVDQGGTQWVDVSHGNWPDYNVHGVSTAVSHGNQSALNQTYGWGTESGSSYGDGGGYDSGVGNNIPDDQIYPYNAISTPSGIGAASQQLAAPVAAAVPSSEKLARPSLGHFYVCGTAMLLGALTATQEVGEELIAGKAAEGEDWGARFRSHSEAHAKAVSPVGGYVLSNHVFGRPAAA